MTQLLEANFLAAKLSAMSSWLVDRAATRRRIVIALFFVQTLAVTGYIMHFLWNSQPYLPSTMVEQVLEDNAARNFATRGFWKYGFLVDYSSSPKDEDHPFLYTHMPSGPTVLLGLLRKASAEILHTRAIYASFALLGCIFVFLFVLAATGIPEVALLSYVMFTLDYVGAIKFSDHYVHSLGDLTFFGTLYFYLRLQENWTRSRLFGFLGLLTASLLTSFLSCIPLALALIALHFIFFRHNSVGFRIFKAGLVTIAFWGTAHFVRNCLVVGTAVTFTDFFYTLTNRIAAWPPKEALNSFFADNNIVMWGVGKVQSYNFNGWLSGAFVDPWLDYQVAILISILALIALRLDWKSALRTAGILIVAFAAIYAWHVIFYAQGSNYTYPPTFRMFRVGLTAACLFLVLETFRQFTLFAQKEKAKFASVGPLGFWILTMAAVFALYPYQRHVRYQNKLLVREARNGYEPAIMDSYLRLGNLPAGEILTNVDALVVNFFTRNLTFGGCDRQGLEDLDVHRCPSSFVSENTKKTAQPKFIFLDHRFSPGYQTCGDECRVELSQKLREKYSVVDEQPGGWVLYEVSKKADLRRTQNP